MFTDSARIAHLSSDCDALSAAASKRSACRYRILICDRYHERRAEAEAFVRDAYYRKHGARIESFMPSLLLLTDAASAISGVAGYREAGDSKLFLERYLDQPVEAALAARTCARVRREQIVELGNFACRSPRVARSFMGLLPHHLLDQNFAWITFTATRPVRRILRHLGARCVDLGAAEVARVSDGADDWGRYYSHDPRVLAGYLPLARRIPALWSAAHAY